MLLPKEMVVERLRARGDLDAAERAERELGEKVDTEDDAGLLPSSGRRRRSRTIRRPVASSADPRSDGAVATRGVAWRVARMDDAQGARGIGRGIALRLAADGLDVAVADLPSMRGEAEAVAEEIRATGRRARRSTST